MVTSVLSLAPDSSVAKMSCSPADVSNFDFGGSAQTELGKKEENRATAWGRDKRHGEYNPRTHLVLTTHPRRPSPYTVKWGAPSAQERGPIIATITQPKHRNAIGTHNGSYSVYRSIAVAAGKMDPYFRPDLHNTAPPVIIPPSPSWFDADKIVSMDPWGHLVVDGFGDELKKEVDIRPTIAITKAHIQMLELVEAMDKGRLVADGKLLHSDGSCVVTKAAIEHVWHLPGVAKRFGISEASLRRCMFEQTGGMFPELVTRSDINIFLPPIGGQTVYVFGPVEYCRDPSKKCTVRVHDECNGSDVFGSDICTCRPYLVHGIEECIRTAQEGGVGVIVYFRKEGRSLGEVTKFLVYNARKRQEGGDRAETYFHRTACVAGVEDMRFQELMPDSLHWLGITKIDDLVSMSDMKYNAIVGSGIQVLNRVAIPDELIPADAHVEIDAKMYAGYYVPEDKRATVTEDLVKMTKGRSLDDDMLAGPMDGV
uniref:GTP cyclohydrolase II n=2 Tax=Cryptomonas curvata TaxID=233186 RepID=A0A7S0QT65_9CRYP|mmetsp:Transcript_51536/g.107680  ORF Transcript_51536/g.107680 Transcript_51536/m.107680 type:complete len:483 (+) Transcript_51536:196-1644(+)